MCAKKPSPDIDAGCFLPNIYQIIIISPVICYTSVSNVVFDLLMSRAWLLPLIYSSPGAHQSADLEKAREERKITNTKAVTCTHSSLCWAEDWGPHLLTVTFMLHYLLFWGFFLQIDRTISQSQREGCWGSRNIFMLGFFWQKVEITALCEAWITYVPPPHA